jgi:hypothetical protein
MSKALFQRKAPNPALPPHGWYYAFTAKASFGIFKSATHRLVGSGQAWNTKPPKSLFRGHGLLLGRLTQRMKKTP